MWESVMEWIGRLSPVAINAWFAHRAYVSIQQHNYAKVAGWMIFILFCECDRIKSKLDTHTDRIDALGEKVRRLQCLSHVLSMSLCDSAAARRGRPGGL